MQWHQLDHMQTICSSLLIDNHTNSSSLNFYRPAAFPDAQPTVLKHWSHIILLYLINKKNFAAFLSSYRSCFCADCRQCYPTLRQKSSNDVLLTQCLHFTTRCTATGQPVAQPTVKWACTFSSHCCYIWICIGKVHDARGYCIDHNIRLKCPSIASHHYKAISNPYPPHAFHTSKWDKMEWWQW